MAVRGRHDPAMPSHFHVDPRALSAGGSALARQYEDEILALSFDDQRYPPVDVARRQCGVFSEARSAAEYTVVLESVGYAFTPSHVEANEGDTAGFGTRATRVLRRGAGDRRIVLRVRGPVVGPPAGRPRGRLAERVRRGVRHQARIRQRYRRGLLRDPPPPPGAGQDAAVQDSPRLGRRPCERSALAAGDRHAGHSPALRPGPLDAQLRGMAVGVGRRERRPQVPVRLSRRRRLPGRVRDRSQYPISRYPGAPKGLYGTSGRLSDDSRYLINNLYGFEDEGGGLWIVDLEDDGFHADDDAFVRIVPWDHALSWFILGAADLRAGEPVSVFLTAKEVDYDFAMTANLLQIGGTGLDARVESQRRLARMVGWNPVPFAVQRLGETRYRVGVQTHFNYEASLMPRATGVYFVEVDTATE